MKNKTFISSVRCALNGLSTAIESEKNFKAYLIHILVTTPFNIWLGFSMIEWVIYIVCVLGVFAMECVNTAIERLCDYLTQEKDENIKIIKDIAAGAVICFGFAFYISEGIMIGAHLIG